MKIKTLAAAAAAALSFASGSVSALPYTAVGVQNDIDYNTVVNGGWSVVYRGDYGASFSVASLFSSIAAGSNVMLAGIHDGSTSFDVLAYATKEEVVQLTGANQTHVANGANWYFNGLSMGFAGLGDSISQNSADILGSGQFGQNPNSIERDRLSWHTSGSDLSNIQVYGGWRSGSNVWLNSSTDWDRVILVQTAVAESSVPEPGTPAMLLTGLGLLGLVARRRKRKAA